MIGVYLSQGIYCNSDTSPLLGDGFHQYVIFDVALRNILYGNGSLFYTFTSGLGLNFYALSSYYLGSFLSPLVYFFNLSNMPDYVYLTTLLKFGLIGLSTYFSLNKLFQSIPKPLKLALSTSYALMSFTVSQLEIKTWLDVFILIPLIITGLHLLITEKKFILYFTSLSPCIHCNICSCKSNKIWTTSPKQSASLVNWALLYRKKQVVWLWL